MDPWPHQLSGHNETLAAIARGERRLCVTSPTGGGKTRMMTMLAKDYLDRRLRVVLYTNRRMLLDQTSNVFLDAGLYHGVRAAGYEDERDHPFQVSSIQTEHSRSMKKKTWDLHNADLVLVDEAHVQIGDTAAAILEAHHSREAAIVGYTATPIGLAGLYAALVVAGTTTSLRDCGALVAARHFGPDEPAVRTLRALKVQEGKDLSENQARKAIMTPSIWGRVWEWFERLNPEHNPTILFAPGVGESIWFAEQFTKRGVRSAHIDGQDIWIDGKFYKSDREARKDVLEGSKDGSIPVLTNRFVLREGIDCPWLAHCIFATIFGSVGTFLQSGGRLLRSYPGLQSVTVQDHGGNWWRHGSLNADRHWRLDATDTMIYGLRADALRKDPSKQPGLCPRCKAVIFGPRCLEKFGGCGWELPAGQKRSRPVVSTDGSLREMTGDVFEPRRTAPKSLPVPCYPCKGSGQVKDAPCEKCGGSGKIVLPSPAVWERMYYRARSKKWSATFRQAFGMFAQENRGFWPDRNWPLMPLSDVDTFNLVRDVPADRLVPKEVPANA
jgi:superfamily II DNA or RNA helicase